jgi:protein ImuB
MEAEQLGSLPVEILGESKMLDTLNRWGVHTFRAMTALPETAVQERLGEAGVRWQRWARGAGSRPLVPAEPSLIFEEAIELEYPVALLEPLAFVLNRMLEQLCARLSARALSTSELRLRLGLEQPAKRGGTPAGDRSNRGFARMNADEPSEIENSTFEIVLRLPVPMLDAKVFLKLLQLELRNRPPGAPIENIFLAAEPVRPRFTQGGLFLPAAPQPEKLEVTLARIRRVVGRELRVANPSGNGERETGNESDNWQLTTDNCLGTAELLDTFRPDAFRMKKFVPKAVASGESRFSSERQKRSVLNPSRSRMSVRRFRPPLPQWVPRPP